MNDGANRGFIDAQTEGDGPYQHANLVGHPALLVSAPVLGGHLGMVRNRRNSLLTEEVHRLFHLVDGGRVHDDVAVGMLVQRSQQEISVLYGIAFAHQVAEIGAVEAGNVFIGIAESELRQDVVANRTGGAGGKSRDRRVWECTAQTAQLAVLGPEFVSPLGDAVGLVDSKKRDGNLLQPGDGIGALQPLGREIKQAETSVSRLTHDAGLFLAGNRAIQNSSRNSHLCQLRRLVLHQRDERRNHDRGSAQHQRRQLVAEGLASAGGHDHTGIVPRNEALDNLLLERAEGTVSPIALQRGKQVGFRGHGSSIKACGGHRCVWISFYSVAIPMWHASGLSRERTAQGAALHGPIRWSVAVNRGE